MNLRTDESEGAISSDNLTGNAPDLTDWITKELTIFSPSGGDGGDGGNFPPSIIEIDVTTASLVKVRDHVLFLGIAI